MIIVPLVSVILISLQGIGKVNDTYKTLTNIYYEKMYKGNELLLNGDRDMYQALIAQSTLNRDNINDTVKLKQKTLKT